MLPIILIKRELDDSSAEFLARLRGCGGLRDADWQQVLGKIPSALEFLAGPNPTVTRSDHGQMVLDPDADPRNANWLRLAAAARLRLPLVTWGLEQRELATGIVDVFASEF